MRRGRRERRRWAPNRRSQGVMIATTATTPVSFGVPQEAPWLAASMRPGPPSDRL